MAEHRIEGRWPFHDQEVIDAVGSVLESGRTNYWTGEECRKFEEEFASYHRVEHAISLANGTLALELALRVLGISHGDEVVVTPRSYFASVSCILLSGATPVFADVDRDSQNITADTIAPLITNKTKALLVVHLAGWPCEMPQIMKLARRHRIAVIEDCAQAHGATIDGKPVGSFGNAAAFSFCQDKIMSTAGEGGMLLLSDKSAWKRAWEFKDHGKSWDAVHEKNHPLGFRWLHESIGSNWRMTELQAAIGRIQLRKLDSWVAKRRQNAKRLYEALNELPLLRIPWPNERNGHSFYKFYAFVRPRLLKTGWTRDRMLSAIENEGIPGLSGSCPEIYREKAFEGARYPELPVARELGETSIMLLVHPTLTEDDLENMIHVVSTVCASATR